jgi:hypothetical protein
MESIQLHRLLTSSTLKVIRHGTGEKSNNERINIDFEIDFAIHFSHSRTRNTTEQLHHWSAGQNLSPAFEKAQRLCSNQRDSAFARAFVKMYYHTA